MKLENGKFTMLVNQDYTEIEIHDGNASQTFCRIKLTPEQLSAALSRRVYVECEIDVVGIDKLGKKHENETFEFEIMEQATKELNGYLNQTCLKALNKAGMSDWTPDNYYSSQNSFFTKDGKKHARTTIRRWV